MAAELAGTMCHDCVICALAFTMSSPGFHMMFCLHRSLLSLIESTAALRAANQVSAAAGVERFRVLKVCQERPVLICDVEVLPEEDDSTTTVRLQGSAYRVFDNQGQACTIMRCHPKVMLDKLLSPSV